MPSKTNCNMELKSVTARFLLLLYIFSLTACKPTTKDQFNRTAMLTSLYDEVILPDCNTATLAVTNLKSKQVAFLNDVNQTTLTELKSAYLEAY